MVNAGSNLGAVPAITRCYSQGSEDAYRNPSLDFSESMLGRYRDLNANLVRLSPTFTVTKGGNGVLDAYPSSDYNFTLMNRQLDAVINDGGVPFLILSIPPASWTNPEIALIVSAVLQHVNARYPSLPQPVVKYVEVWNEPDGPNTPMSAANYGPYYANISKAVKDYNTTIKVGGPTLSTMTGNSATAYMNTFLTYIAANSTRKLDFVSWHFYNYAQGPWGRPNSELGTEITAVKNMVNSLGISPMPEIMIDEFNLNASLFDKLDRNVDASYLMQFYKDVMLFANKPTKLFFFEPKDGQDPNPVVADRVRFWGRWGALTYDNYPKPAYNALKMIASMPLTARLDTSITGGIAGVDVLGTKDTVTSLVEVLVWNHNNFPVNMSVNVHTLPAGNKQYTRMVVDDRNGNAFFNLRNAELPIVDSTTLSAASKNTTLQLGPFGVTKLSFRPVAGSAPSAPTFPTVAAQLQKNIVRWQASPTAVSYTISRATTLSGNYTDIATGITGTVYNDATSNGATNYYYKVKAVNAAGSATSAAAGPASWSGNASNLSMPVTYADDFRAYSNVNQWTKVGGTWSISNGDLIQANTTGETRATLPCVKHLGAKGSVSVDIKITGGTSWAGFTIRKTNVSDGLYASGYMVHMRGNGKIDIYKGGVGLIGTGADTVVDPTARFVNLKCVFDGGTIKVYADGIPCFTVTDSTFTSGYVSLVTNNVSARFQNLEITKDTFEDTFSSVADANWVKTGGSWSIDAATASLKQATASGQARASMAMNNLQEGTVSADIRILSGSGWAGLGLKRTTPEEGVYVSGYIVYLKSNGNLGVYKNGTGLMGSEVATGTNPGLNFVNVKVTFANGDIKVYINNAASPLVTKTDRGFNSGSIAVATDAASALFDNIKVFP